VQINSSKYLIFQSKKNRQSKSKGKAVAKSKQSKVGILNFIDNFIKGWQLREWFGPRSEGAA
jgi:hypothetical protein